MSPDDLNQRPRSDLVPAEPAIVPAFSDQRSVRLKYTAKRLLARAIPCDKVLWCGRERACDGVALTFDDGPDPEITPRLLDVLDEHAVKATFFVFGRAARSHGELLESIKERGHEVGSHGFVDVSLRTMTDSEIGEAVASCDQHIGGPGGSVPLFRPPFGEYRLRQLPLLWKLDKTVVFWSLDSRDFAATSPEHVLSNVPIHRLRRGDILLFHDKHAHTVQAIRTLIPRIRERGLALRTVGEIIQRSMVRAQDD